MTLVVEFEMRKDNGLIDSVVLVMKEDEYLPNIYEIETVFRNAIRRLPKSASFMTIVRVKGKKK